MGERTVRLSPQDAREALYGLPVDAALRRAVWRQAAVEAQREKPGSGDGTWRLFAVWLAIPGLYRNLHRITRYLGADRTDLEAEAVLALLEAFEAVDPESPDAGGRVVKDAVNRMWDYATRTCLEVPVVDIAAVSAARNGVAGSDGAVLPTEGWELHITPPPLSDGLATTLRFTDSRSRKEGERLGALAQCAGLPHLVFRARRHEEAARIGTLVLRPVGAGR
ncbi:hypothetical protein ACFH04_14960 [Streptomyces noboritoensis]|uniref:Uncharacterized protein n=1 Tax=Streptomyces noboritoensis TaxID=67337 RepID=A0ABV6TGT4_9ACTN